MDSPLTRAFSIDDLTQPKFEKIVHRILSNTDPAGILAAIPGLVEIPGYGLLIATTVKPAQEAIKSTIEGRQEERLHKHLGKVASTLTAIQKAHYNTFAHVINSLDLLSLRTLNLAEETGPKRTFWATSKERLGADRKEIDSAISELERIGLISIKKLFQQADGTFSDHPDLKIALDYTDLRRGELREWAGLEDDRIRNDFLKSMPDEQYPAHLGIVDPKPKVFVEKSRLDGWKMINFPQVTLSGFFFLELFAIEASSQNDQNVTVRDQPTAD